jgi:hypothetical protein
MGIGLDFWLRNPPETNRARWNEFHEGRRNLKIEKGFLAFPRPYPGRDPPLTTRGIIWGRDGEVGLRKDLLDRAVAKRDVKTKKC